jgi:pyruvate dehydrogenase E1 component beta subunit
MDQIVNNAATLLHMSGGQCPVPLVIRMTTGGGRQLAAQHSHSFEAWYAHVPGLRVVAPATVADAYGMMRAALTWPDPVVYFEHGGLYGMEGELADDAGATSLTGAARRREGDDVTIVAYGGMVPRALAAADQLAARGVQADVIDLRSLRPIDDATIVESVQRTHRVVVVDEGWRSVGLSAEIAARVGELAFYELDAPVERVCTVEVPLPYPKHLEDAAMPSVDRIVDAVVRSRG